MNEQQENPSFFKEMNRFMKPYQTQYALSVFISILGVAAHVLSYACIGWIIALLFKNETQTIWTYVLLAGLCRLLHALFCNVSKWLSHHAAYATLKDIRKAMCDKMLRLPLGYFEKNGSGRLKSLITDQVESMEKPLAHVLPELTGNILGPVVLMIWLFILDWRLGLCQIVWILLGFSVTGGMMKNYPEKFAGQIKASQEMNQSISEYVAGIEVIKNFGQDDACCHTFEKNVYNHAAYNVNWQKETQIYSALGMAIAPFSIFPVLIAGLLLHLDASTLFLGVMLTMGVFGPLMQTMGYFDQLAQMGTIAKEMNGILNYPEVKRGNQKLQNKSDITFDHVKFAYEENHWALNDVSFHIPSHSIFALVGPSGSGKSTIAKLLAGYWDVNEGCIRIGDTNLNDCSQEEINQTIAFVDQDTFLFDRSIADNIRLAKPDASDEEVRSIAKKAGCDDFIQKLENGYDSFAGHRLSGGERQRISIARAMMKDAPILILDEATASADPENEALIQKALSAAAQDKTVVVVAHHLNTIVHADQIAFMNHGRIEQIDTHENLLKSCSQYKELYELSKEG